MHYNNKRIRLAIDASRVRSGGAIAHIIGILSESLPLDYDIDIVHLFAPSEVCQRVPQKPWLFKYSPYELTKSLPFQLFWQAKKLGKCLDSLRCNLLFTVDASTLSNWKPCIVLSQDMLSYEPGIMRQFGFSKARLRLETIKLLQNRAMRKSAGVIFLTNYSAKAIQNSCGSLRNIKIIPHGINSSFRNIEYLDRIIDSSQNNVRCCYVSNTALYKNQWRVVEAISKLREEGINIYLTLVGGGKGTGLKLTKKSIYKTAKLSNYVSMIGFSNQEVVLKHLKFCDIFVFASSCENLPVTLLEGMAAGLPIACSDKGPMPEILKDNGVYFDPTNSNSISKAIRKLIENHNLRIQLAKSAKQASKLYTWKRCGEETWSFLHQTFNSLNDV